MGDITTTRWYKITAAAGGSMEFWVDERDFTSDSQASEREVVAHAAWRWMFNQPSVNHLTGERNNIAKVLRNLCDTVGVDLVKKKFTNSIVFERIR